MKAFTKRLIWFFGFLIYLLLQELVYYYIHNIPLEYGESSIIYLFILIIPLILMEDDKITNYNFTPSNINYIKSIIEYRKEKIPEIKLKYEKNSFDYTMLDLEEQEIEEIKKILQ